MTEKNEIVLSLKPLWENTKLDQKIRDPNLADPEDQKAFADLCSEIPLRRAMGEAYFRIPWVTCPNCQRVWDALTVFGLCVHCIDQGVADEKKQKELGEYLQKTIGRFGIEKYSFENYDAGVGNLLAWEALKDFNHLTDNVFVYGSPGTGKTHLAGAALKRACSQNLSVAWLQPMYVGRTLRSKFPSEEEAIIDDWIRKDVLIIDDIGVGRDLEITLRMIYEITDKRKAARRNGLILVSNEPLDVLGKAFKDIRIISRINGLCRVIHVMGDDRRMKRGA